MENKLELAKENLQLFSQEGNKLKSEESQIFAKHVLNMALAKNIVLAQGTLAVWEECFIEDLKAKQFRFFDFMQATKMVIREQKYNRIDYADIYLEASLLGGAWRRKIQNDSLGVFDHNPMPKEIKDMVKKIGTRINN